MRHSQQHRLTIKKSADKNLIPENISFFLSRPILENDYYIV